MRRRCEDCNWWDEISEEKKKEAEEIQQVPIGPSGAGSCRCGLPICLAHQNDRIILERGAWPITYGQEFCSKFQDRQ